VAATIVVGFDGSDRSGRALDRAIADTKSASGSLVVVVVAPMPFDPLGLPELGLGGLGPPDPSEQALRELVAEDKTPPALQPVVDEAAKRTSDAGIEAEIIWRLGDPGRELVDIARQRKASKIVLGEHHHRRLSALFGEDVDAAVKHEANCELTLVP